jgi:hypothetical protein
MISFLKNTVTSDLVKTYMTNRTGYLSAIHFELLILKTHIGIWRQFSLTLYSIGLLNSRSWVQIHWRLLFISVSEKFWWLCFYPKFSIFPLSDMYTVLIKHHHIFHNKLILCWFEKPWHTEPTLGIKNLHVRFKHKTVLWSEGKWMPFLITGGGLSS